MRAKFDAFETIEHRLATEREENVVVVTQRAVAGATGGLAGSVLLVVVFAGYLSRAILQPVRRAAMMADQLAAGDLSTRMPETGAAEIGGLERSFNSMARSLGESRDELSRLAGDHAALRRVATLVAHGVPPDRVFAAVTEEVGRLLGADGTRLLRYETDGEATVVASLGQPGFDLPVGMRLSLDGRNVPALVMRSRSPARMDDFADTPSPLAVCLHRLGVRSMIGAPVVVEGRLWGVMTALSTREKAFAAGTESRIADFTDLVATAIANTQARAELTASRARVVTATDQTRRRIERDLHDGTQQRLVSLALDLRTAEASVSAEQPELRAQLTTIANGLAGALDDLREISRGIHPAILSEGGLRPALRALARRSAVPVEIDVPVGTRFAQPIEVAAYYVVAEALTNAARHARTSYVRVEVTERDHWLHLSVRDDGVGGADPARGSGLVGLTDRVEALGGTITITSPAGQGTTLEVELPG
jgi:signal transduction histidine kinase